MNKREFQYIFRSFIICRQTPSLWHFSDFDPFEVANAFLPCNFPSIYCEESMRLYFYFYRYFFRSFTKHFTKHLKSAITKSAARILSPEGYVSCFIIRVIGIVMTIFFPQKILLSQFPFRNFHSDPEKLLLVSVFFINILSCLVPSVLC